MKGDFTRFTFDPKKHYSGVRMQQGRVLLDSDWNEQADINDHRSETQAKDIIGRSGCPVDQAGFKIIMSTDDSGKRTGDFIISAGRYYVDGILCENEKDLKYTEQRSNPSPLGTEFLHIFVYLDVWKRHVSSIEDPEIREIALGGPDTTTRVETAWQVRAFMPKKELQYRCMDISEFIPALSSGRLNVSLSPSTVKSSKCSLAPRGSYQGLENRLYRVEIHDSGQHFGWHKIPEDVDNTIAFPTLPDGKPGDGTDGQIVVEDWSPDGLPWRQGQLVEIFTLRSTEKGTLAKVVEADATNKRLKLNLDISKLGAAGDLRFHRVATFKWSKDNGSVAYPIDSFPDDQPTKGQITKVTMRSLGRDKTLSLRSSDCVEVLGDATEFRCEPGTMAVITENGVDEARRTLILSQDLSRHKDKAEANLKIRRWDRSSSSDTEDAVRPITLDEVELEDGIIVQFSISSGIESTDTPSTMFWSGDYWTFPARSADGKLKELKDAPPEGIEHHYCSLARIPAEMMGDVMDCRRLFPPSVDILNMYYLGGDGQVAVLNQELAYPLVVGVAMGKWPVANAKVMFSVTSGNSTIVESKQSSYTALTNEEGIAKAGWRMRGPDQQPVDISDHHVVEAILQDRQGNPMGMPIYFSADLRIAHLSHFSGNDQEIMPDPGKAEIVTSPDNQAKESLIALPQQIVVRVINNGRPVTDAIVKFSALRGRVKGTDNAPPIKEISVPVDADGKAGCTWYLSLAMDSGGQYMVHQELEATLGSLGGIPINDLATNIRFSARLNSANSIMYDPASCPKLGKLQGVTTVKDAINQLCPANMLYYVGGDGQDGLPNQLLPQKLQVMVADSRGPVLLSMPVNFTAARGGGKVQEAGDPVGHDSVTISTKDGIAECNWILGPSGDQQVEASIPGIKPIRFSANLNLAALVAYTPPKDCVKMSGIGDVQNAINQLCPANILYAVSGDGQVGTPGEIVTLQVGVADSRGPVLSKVPIQFKVLPEVTPAPILIPPGYNGNGIYEWKWTLGGLTTQQVEASLLSPDGKTPIGLPVRFNAFLRTADSIAYANSNPNLHLKVNTVQEALEQLSSDRSDFNITGVQFLAEYGQKLSSLDNGAVIRADLLVQSGLSISCSEDVDPLSFREDGGLLLRRVLRKPACTVFIEAPYFSPNEREISSQQLALAGIANVPTNNANVILWMPSSSKTSDILDTLSYYCAHASDVGNDNGLILAHLLIKGNFVRNKKLNKYLDGDRFATSTTGQLSRFLPSGDGRAGSDFEMWFWISDPIMVSLSDLSGVKLTSANSPVNITGSLKLDRNAPADLEFSITQTTNIPNLKFASFSATIMNGFPSVSFSFSLSVSMMPTDKTGGPFTISAVLQKWNGIQVDNSVIRNSRSINVAFQ